MAGNKYDTVFEKEKVKDIEITYTGLYNQKITFTGTIEQAIRHLIQKL